MYFVDSGTETIVACDTDAQGVPRRGPDGALLQRTVSDRPTGHKHVPDGMTIDAEGNLWVALGESGAVVCYDAGSGAELRRVALPVQRPTACTFGGPGKPCCCRRCCRCCRRCCCCCLNFAGRVLEGGLLGAVAAWPSPFTPGE